MSRKNSISQNLKDLCEMVRENASAAEILRFKERIVSEHPDLSSLVNKLSPLPDLNSLENSFYKNLSQRNITIPSTFDQLLSSHRLYILSGLGEEELLTQMKQIKAREVVQLIDNLFDMANIDAIARISKCLHSLKTICNQWNKEESIFIRSYSLLLLPMQLRAEAAFNHTETLTLSALGEMRLITVSRHLGVALENLKAIQQKDTGETAKSFEPEFHIDTVEVDTITGLLRVHGWADDAGDLLEKVYIELNCRTTQEKHNTTFVRNAREDLTSHSFDTQGITRYFECAGFIASTFASTDLLTAIFTNGNIGEYKITCVFQSGAIKSSSSSSNITVTNSILNASMRFRQAITEHVITDHIEFSSPYFHRVVVRNWESYIRKSLSNLNIIFASQLNSNYRPRATVIIPIYGNLDLMRHQLQAIGAYQSQNRDIYEYEFLFACDDPRIEEDFKYLCKVGQKCYGAKFTAISYGMNLGFSSANNIAASVALADKLILQNSDVFIKPFEISKIYTHLLDAIDADSTVGLAGCWLNFADGSIQHIGMNSIVFPGQVGLLGRLGLNDHPLKGAQYKNIDKIPMCTLATAALCSIRKETFYSVGGLSTSYVIGDFEDSDLCYKLIRNGMTIKNLQPPAMVYHLERQSFLFDDLDIAKLKLVAFNASTHWMRHAATCIHN